MGISPTARLAFSRKFRDGNAGAFGYGSGSREKGVFSWTGRAIPSPPHGQSPMGPHLSLGALFPRIQSGVDGPQSLSGCDTLFHCA